MHVPIRTLHLVPRSSNFNPTAPFNHTPPRPSSLRSPTSRALSLGLHDSAIASSFDLFHKFTPAFLSPASTMSWEAMLPLGIISAMIFVMGSSQYVIHTTIYGKPKHPRHDAWDRAMDERDARLKEEYEKSQK